MIIKRSTIDNFMEQVDNSTIRLLLEYEHESVLLSAKCEEEEILEEVLRREGIDVEKFNITGTELNEFINYVVILKLKSPEENPTHVIIDTFNEPIELPNVASHDPIDPSSIIHYNRENIQEKDLNCLRNTTEWVNDIVIDCFLNEIKNSNDPKFAEHTFIFSTQFVELMKSCDKNYETLYSIVNDKSLLNMSQLLFPVNLENRHWILVALLPGNFMAKTTTLVCILNSKPAFAVKGEVVKMFGDFFNWLECKEISATTCIEIKFIKVNEQVDDNSCGVSVMMNAVQCFLQPPDFRNCSSLIYPTGDIFSEKCKMLKFLMQKKPHEMTTRDKRIDLAKAPTKKRVEDPWGSDLNDIPRNSSSESSIGSIDMKDYVVDENCETTDSAPENNGSDDELSI